MPARQKTLPRRTGRYAHKKACIDCVECMYMAFSLSTFLPTGRAIFVCLWQLVSAYLEQSIPLDYFLETLY